ncbi:MAG TPA: ABC transporter permease [Vicinamibacterales bacterium]|nr:ABC transporter permease [Vicinamibacterales bacterium]
MIERLFRLLLRLTPRRFRDEFGTDLLATAREVDAERPRTIGRTIRAVADAAAMPLAVRADLRRQRRRPRVGRGASLRALAGDARFAVRSLAHEPGFTLFVCATLALGIGANAAMFGLADRLLLSGPAHVRDARRVVRLYSTQQPDGMRAFTSPAFGYVTYDLLRQRSRAFSEVASYAIGNAVEGRGASARPIRVGYASAELFALLGVTPLRGRFLTPAEDSVAGAERVAVLSYSTWQSWFAGDDSAIGRTVVVNDETHVVIGVAPRAFTGPELGRVDLWAPMTVLSARVTPNFTTAWNAQWLKIVGRLAPGVTPEAAGTELTSIYRRGYTGDDGPAANARLSVASLRAGESGSDAAEVHVLRWLTGVTLAVLLIACANVTNLLLARGVRRSRDLAIRAALGASRARLLRMLLFEAIGLAQGGALLGLAIAQLIGDTARRTLFSAVEWTGPPVDRRVLVVSGLVALVTGVLIGLVPAVRASRPWLASGLKPGEREGGARRSKLRTSLMVVQAALSVVLLVGAGLFIKSLWHLSTMDLGFDPDRVIVVDVNRGSLSEIPDGPMREAARASRRTFYNDLLDRVRALPRVEAASVATGMPFGYRFTLPVRRPDRPEMPRLPSGLPSLGAVTPGYFDTMGTAIVRGRAFSDRDGPGTEPVAIVSERMAGTVWPDENPIGKCLLVGQGSSTCTRVVGVAEDTHRSRLLEPPVMHYYIPAGQEVGFSGPVLLVRVATASPPPFADLRRLLTEADRTITYVRAETLQSRIDPQMQPWQLGASVFTLSGVLALVVAGIGIYSVMSYLIADRRREIGVRLALGARPVDIVGLVLRGSLVTALAGVLAGEVIAVALGRFVEPLLVGTSARDPFVLGATGALLLAVAGAATLGPARRARSVDPVGALRAE